MDKQIKSSRRYLFNEENDFVEEADDFNDSNDEVTNVKALPDLHSNEDDIEHLVMEQDIMP